MADKKKKNVKADEAAVEAEETPVEEAVVAAGPDTDAAEPTAAEPEESPAEEPVPEVVAADEPAAEEASAEEPAAEPVAEAPADQPVVEEEPAAEAAADEPAAEAPAAEAPAEEPAAEPVAEAPADEPAAEAPATEAPAAEPPAPAPQSGPKPKKKRLPRSLRPARTRPKREKATERRPIVRLDKPEHDRGRRQERQGKVVYDAMDKTIVVKVDTIKSHPRYKKVVRRSTKFHAHDEQNQAKTGDIVRIVETRPISKNKRWRLAEVVEAAK